MNKDIKTYNDNQTPADNAICERLTTLIHTHLKNAESKIWHGHPVWFLNGNPIVGYSKVKESVRLMFWSGADFNEKKLQPGTGKFKDASVRYDSVDQISEAELKRWLKKAVEIQWDYKKIVKRKGNLIRLK